MRPKAITLAALTLFLVAGIAFIVTKWVFPGQSTTLGQNLLLATTAIGGAAAAISGFKDAVDFFQKWLTTGVGYKKKYLEHIYSSFAQILYVH